MISPDRLERYKDFVDPDRTGALYNPRQGLERLMGILSPDTKGIVLAAMESDWYGDANQLRSRVFVWLDELGLPSGLWPITTYANWSYCILKYKGETVDGSLVRLGAVVKKAEQEPFRVLYSRSLAGAELAVPLVQQAVKFVSKAKEYAEAQKIQGKTPHKFDSMWRIIGAVNSSTDQRRPSAVWNVIDFLVHNHGKNRKLDLQNQLHILPNTLGSVLSSLGDCGIIDYKSPLTDIEGRKGNRWVIYRLADQQSRIDLDPNKIYSDIRSGRKNFYFPTILTKITDYIKEYPNGEYEQGVLAERLNIVYPNSVGSVLSRLAELGMLIRQEPGFRGKERVSFVSVNYLTHLFYDFVCAPVKSVADTLSPLRLGAWDREDVALYLHNYDEERSQVGLQGGVDARSLLVGILSQFGKKMKLSYIIDLYNSQVDRELKGNSLHDHLKMLVESGEIEQPRPGYYRIVNK